MKTYKQVVRKVEDIVYCDICGKTCTNDNYGSEYASLEAIWTYGSKHDGERFDIQLCENCFFETIHWMKNKRLTNLIEDDTMNSISNDPFNGETYNI